MSIEHTDGLRKHLRFMDQRALMNLRDVLWKVKAEGYMEQKSKNDLNEFYSEVLWALQLTR